MKLLEAFRYQIGLWCNLSWTMRILNVLFLQIGMSEDEVSRVKLELVPMIQEVLTDWHIIYFFCTTPSESPLLEDFSSQLSSLQLGR